MAGLRCPCADLKRGAADLAIAASMLVQPQIFFDGGFVPVVTAALHGSAPFGTAAVLIVWVVTLAAGLFESLEGYRAAQSHRDPSFNAENFAIAFAVGLFCLYALYAGWSLPLEWGGLLAACSRCALLAVVAYNAAGLWLSLRAPLAGIFVRRSPPRNDDPPPYTPFSDWFSRPVEPQDSGAVAQLAQYREVMDGLAQEVEENRRVVAERDRAITEIAAERDHAVARGDRFQANGKALLAEVGELRSHAEAIRKVPGGWQAVSKAAHPDTGPPGDRAARTEIFKLVKLIFEGR